MAQYAEESDFLLLISYSTIGDEWEEAARSSDYGEIETALQELSDSVQHYAIVRVEDCGEPLAPEEAEEYEY
jgi:hypothetical protein